MNAFERNILVSQLPLDVVGGGEFYTLASYQQLAELSQHSELWYSETPQAGLEPFAARSQRVYIRALCEHGKCVPQEKISLRQLQERLTTFDCVAIHQYLSCSSTIDLITALAPDQKAILTSLGHEGFADGFRRIFEPSANVSLFEISEYAAERASTRGFDAGAACAGVFSADVRPISEIERRGRSARQPRAVAVGRLLPHKGFEVTIGAMPAQWQLDIIGPPSGDDDYEDHLKHVASSHSGTTIHGFVERAQRDQVMQSADVLVASSCEQLYNGGVLEQAELFGLVILEAVAVGVLPISSDLPSFCEIMRRLELEDFIYPARDTEELSKKLTLVQQMSDAAYFECVQRAQKRMCENYLWETYWHRMFQQIAPPERPALRLVA